MKTRKSAIIMSAVAILLCVAMLAGSTFAWFTDNVTSSGNIITAGNLDVEMHWTDDLTTNQWTDASTGAIFNYDKWEPGYTEVRYVKVENKGSLDLRYVLTIDPKQEAEAGKPDLAEVIDVYMFDGEATLSRTDIANATPVATVAELIADADGAAYGVLYADAAKGKVSETYTIVLKMRESAGNEYQGLSVGGGFSVTLLATQLVSESDSFGNDYDKDATYPVVGSASAPVTNVDPMGKLTVEVFNTAPTDAVSKKVATLVFDESSLDPDAEAVDVEVEQTLPQSQSSIGIEVDGVIETYEFTVKGIKDGNTEEVEVWLHVGPGKNIGTTIYHTKADSTVEQIPCTYDTYSGNVRFKTTSFSPFSVVNYNEPIEVTNPDLPQSTLVEVEKKDEYVDWMISEGEYAGIIKLVAPETLDAFYSFKTNDTPEAASANKYADWKCDFFVKVSEDIPAESIILGGYYEQFGGAVAFTNLVEVEGDTWIPLLLLVSNGWTYEEIATGVGEFICGVKDVDSNYLKNNNIKFTVQLRLIDPEFNDALNLQPEEYIVINEVVYDFATGTSTIVK